MYTNFFATCINDENSKNNVDYDCYPILCDPCDNYISLSPNGSNLECGTITSQSEGINDETGLPSNYFLEGNESDKGGSINLDNTDNFESPEVRNNSEQFHNRVLDEDPAQF